MRDIVATQKPNDGTRTLYNSILVPEIRLAIANWIKENTHGVLIGGVALSYYVKPRTTQDIDLLFLSEQVLPKEVKGFKRIRDHGFEHIKTGVEVEALTPEFLKISSALVQQILHDCVKSSNVQIASPSSLVALKLSRLSFQDKADIQALLECQTIDLSHFALPRNLLQKFDKLKQEIEEHR